MSFVSDERPSRIFQRMASPQGVRVENKTYWHDLLAPYRWKVVNLKWVGDTLVVLLPGQDGPVTLEAVPQERL